MKLTTLGPLLGVILSCQAGFAQYSANHAVGLHDAQNEKVVRAWYSAWVKKDWNSLTQVLADGFTFSSPLDDHIKLDSVKERCWPNAYKIKRIDIESMVINGDVAIVVGNGWTTEGKFIRNADYFKLKDGKIIAYECFFGPGINFPNSGK